MTPERWRKVTDLFHAALERDPAVRAAFLEDACRQDPSVRAEVEGLLVAHGSLPSGAAALFDSRPLTPTHTTPAAADILATDLESARPESELAPAPRHPFRLLAAFVALVSVSTFSYAAWQLIQTQGTTKDFGWQEGRRPGGPVITAVSADGPAAGRVEVGDRIVALNGTRPFGGGTNLHRRGVRVGDTYRLTLDRKGERIDTVLPVGPGPNALGHYLTYFFTSLVWVVVGVFLGLARPDNRVARVASGAAVTTGLGYLNAGVLDIGHLFNPLHVILGAHFFSVFPTGRVLTGIWKWTLVVSYAAAIGLVSLHFSVQAAYVFRGVPGVAALVTSHPSLFAIRSSGAAVDLFYAALAGMVAAAIYNYRQLTDDNERRRVKWVAYGSILSLTPQVILSIGELTVGSPVVGPWLGQSADALSAGVPLFVAYAVVKHRVFDIRVVIRRGIQYLLARGALLALVVVPLLALTYTVFVNRHRTIVELVTENTAYLYWIVIAGLALRFRQPVRLWLDRRFFRDEYDREQLLLALLDDLGKVDSIAQLSEMVNAKLESALHPAGVYFWYRDPGELAAASASNPVLTPPDFPVEGRWLSWLEDRAAAAELPLPAAAGLLRHQIRWLTARNINLVIPIGDSAERLAGVLLLGPKKSEEPYGPNDRRLLLAITKQLAVVRENLRLRAQVSDEQRIRHDVLARLDDRRANLLKECPECGTCFDGSAERCDRDGYALTMSLPVARIVEGKYRLDRLIGKGGMGAVYEAYDLRLARVVAVKILLGRAFGQPTALRRFQREARAAARLDHPRIVRVHDYGALEGEGAYIVMERLEGSTLRDELRRCGAMTPSGVADWFDQILDGLAGAHSHGIIHRDLKPENVVGRRDAEQRLAITIVDFGLAKEQRASDALTSGSVTVEGVVMGTIGYMSPEQLLGHVVDQRTDIFAVGIMLAEGLTGRRPFDGDALLDVSRAVLHEAYHLPFLSPDAVVVDGILQRCLAKDPSERFASAEALRELLIPALRRWSASSG